MFLCRLTKASAISGMSEGPSSGSVRIVASSSLCLKRFACIVDREQKHLEARLLIAE